MPIPESSSFFRLMRLGRWQLAAKLPPCSDLLEELPIPALPYTVAAMVGVGMSSFCPSCNFYAFAVHVVSRGAGITRRQMCHVSAAASASPLVWPPYPVAPSRMP